ncbi:MULTISPECIES: DUF565 domain-containing protein [unclassified Leptolyngbya]|uniref:DUF565 domain-containing protein n=1 Tax=unclassified Leptolyngbya TaxID=2650499 RepID=UPI001688D03A|nr:MULTISPECIES: DUF565 domain-containing protein [unclassified Leptolyngbya]MBD1912170.1 DUF565 domain-containing protein [Leptolyngbya sp. FACHB-8]MBD2155061.1 DUF565 domain-containing protein [Leptolyngbya sp. FACHB-16]
MQNTRLNRLVSGTTQQFGQWIRNPWRRISLIVLGLLFGNFLATAFATSAGQQAELDILAGATLVAFTEGTSWFFYRRSGRGGRTVLPNEPRALLTEVLNAIKIGLTYGLFIEAFKLGS